MLHKRIIPHPRAQAPHIACINRSSKPLGVSFPKLVAALQKFVDLHFGPVWGAPAHLSISRTFHRDRWAIVFLDDTDAANDLGYHDLTRFNLPMSRVFVRTLLANGDTVSLTTSHELAEMLIDPAVNLFTVGPHSRFYAYEVADAVEEEKFLVDGLEMTDFVYPAWFESFRKEGSTQFDHCDKCTRPFQILKGGYMPVFERSHWRELSGSRAKAARLAREDRQGHRIKQRSRSKSLTPSTAR